MGRTHVVYQVGTPTPTIRPFTAQEEIEEDARVASSVLEPERNLKAEIDALKAVLVEKKVVTKIDLDAKVEAAVAEAAVAEAAEAIALE